MGAGADTVGLFAPWLPHRGDLERHGWGTGQWAPRFQDRVRATTAILLLLLPLLLLLLLLLRQLQASRLKALEPPKPKLGADRAIGPLQSAVFANDTGISGSDSALGGSTVKAHVRGLTFDHMVDWLEDAGVPGLVEFGDEPWIPNHNKITVDCDATYARELFGRPRQRLQFNDAVVEHMLLTARSCGGYVANLTFFNQWTMLWNEEAHPGRVLQAARRSCFPPKEALLYKWVRLHFPCWLRHFWPEGPPTLHNLCTPIDLNSMD